MSDQRLKIAVFIDFDNVEIGVKTTLGLHFDVGAVLEAIKERGEIITKIAYSDWKRSGDHGRAMANHAVRLVQRVMTPGGDKNGADINLALDALEMAFTHDHINAFVIVGGDSDFITLVEKLKQYDKKVFVVGGRSFTSQVMQKNCTEFIAYENIARTSSPPRADRGRASGAGSASLDHAMPLVKRALQVLTDREVTPQLGLLKSTLLQLDSSFSERDYGVSSFRDFAERLAQRGFVTLRHTGRSTLVELAEGATTLPENGAADASAELSADLSTDSSAASSTDLSRRSDRVAEAEARRAKVGARSAKADGAERRDEDGTAVNLSEGLAVLRRALADPPQPPRWPMYLRQMKQFLRSADAEFDDRKYGSIVELMRAGQKEGLVRLERDRQGGLRVFAVQTPFDSAQGRAVPQPTGQVYRPKGVTPGWTLMRDSEESAAEEPDTSAAASADASADTSADAAGASSEAEAVPPTPLVITPPIEEEEPHDAQTNFFGPEGVIEQPVPGAPKRQRRGARKPVAGDRALSLSKGEEKPKRARKAPVTRKTAAPRARRKPVEK